MSAFLEAARVLRKAVCLSVGGSEPVAHWLGLSSWDVMVSVLAGKGGLVNWGFLHVRGDG